MFVAGDAELAAELRCGHARCAASRAPQELEAAKTSIKKGAPKAVLQFYTTLVVIEVLRLLLLEEVHGVKHRVCNLTQDPSFCRAAGRELLINCAVAELHLWFLRARSLGERPKNVVVSILPGDGF